MNLKSTASKAMNIPWISFPVTVLQRFGGDNGGLFAAGLAFFMLLSFAPLILTGVAVMAFFIHDPTQAADKVQQIVQGMLPNGGAQDAVKSFLDSKNLNGQMNTLMKGRTLAGLIGFLTLIWTSIQIFINASSAMNAAFEVKEKRSWLLLRGVALGLLFVSGILVSATLFLSAAPSAISSFGQEYIPFLKIPLWMLTILFEVLAVLVNAILYLIIYRFLPSTNVTWKAALVGGLVASIFWEIAKKGLASWLLKANHSLYGELANLILFVLWIYYSMMILLIGAEVAAVYQKTGSFARRSAHFGQPAQDSDEQVHRSPRPTRDQLIRKGSKGRGAEMG